MNQTYIYTQSFRDNFLTSCEISGPDILIATHSTEIISEAETGDIVLVNKAHQRARRIRDPGEVAGVFGILR